MSAIRNTGLTMLGGALGAAAAYLLDPQMGRTRRTMARDRMLGQVRRTGRDLERKARYATHTAAGKAKGAVAAAKPAEPAPNDVALARKVETVIFRPEDAPKGRVSVNAENGIVFLRGEVETQEQIDGLVHSASGVEGVRAVENLMHLPGTPAPTSTSRDPLSRLEHETTPRNP
jgi:gas vesicle protein